MGEDMGGWGGGVVAEVAEEDDAVVEEAWRPNSVVDEETLPKDAEEVATPALELHGWKADSVAEKKMSLASAVDSVVEAVVEAVAEADAEWGPSVDAANSSTNNLMPAKRMEGKMEVHYVRV